MAVLLVGMGMLYVTFALLVALRLRRMRAIATPGNMEEPLVSVIVAVRNEAESVMRCLESLLRLDYAQEKLQIVIVNDDSRDGSGAQIDAFCQPWRHMQVIHLGPGEKSLPGKAGAVLHGLEMARGEIIFLTDADCEVPVSWIRGLLAGFAADTGLVCGFTILRARRSPAPLFQEVQALDWLFLLGVAAAAMELGRPVSWMGNNLAFRRSAYEAVGGYRTIGNSLIEDFTLLDAISRKSRYTVAVQPDRAAVVVSAPVTRLRQLYEQRRRWAMGIRPVRPLGKGLMISGFMMHLLLLAGCFLTPWLSLLVAAVKCSADLQIIASTAQKSGARIGPGAFLGFELFYSLYTLIMPLSLLFDRRIQWKDQDYSIPA